MLISAMPETYTALSNGKLDSLLPKKNGLLVVTTGRIGEASLSRLLEYSDDDKFCQRSAYVAAVEDEWWRRWISTVLPTLLPARKWNKEEKNLMVGDVVMLTYPGNVKDDYVLARVIELFPDAKNLARRVKVKYRRKNSKEDRKVCKSKMIEEIVAVQRLSLLEPVPRTDSSPASSAPPNNAI